MGDLDALVSASWQGALLALLVWGFCRRPFPKVPARYRAALWWTVGLKMALAVLVPLALALPLLAPAAAAPGPVGAPLAAAPEGAVTAPVRNPLSSEGLLRVAWLAGATVLLLAHLHQGRRLQGVLRRSRGRGVAVAFRSPSTPSSLV